jgi:hypothetical protein
MDVCKLNSLTRPVQKAQTVQQRHEGDQPPVKLF